MDANAAVVLKAHMTVAHMSLHFVAQVDWFADLRCVAKKELVRYNCLFAWRKGKERNY
jgi:hypothetical protein